MGTWNNLWHSKSGMYGLAFETHKGCIIKHKYSLYKHSYPLVYSVLLTFTLYKRHTNVTPYPSLLLKLVILNWLWNCPHQDSSSFLEHLG